MENGAQTLVQAIIEAAVVPLIYVLASYLIAFIKSKTEALKENQKFQHYKEYISIAEGTVINVVQAIESSIVKAAKYKGEWTPEKKKEAFDEAMKLILAQLTVGAKDAIQVLYGDLNKWLETQIEQNVLLISHQFNTTEIAALRRI